VGVFRSKTTSFSGLELTPCRFEAPDRQGLAVQLTTIPGSASYFPLLLRWFGPPWGPSLAFGVGNSDAEPSVSLVGGSQVGSSKSRPPEVIPDRGQVFSDDIEAPRPERRNVLQERVTRSYIADGPADVLPDPRPLAIDPIPSAGVGGVAAGEPGHDGVHQADELREVVRRDVADVRHVGPVVLEHERGRRVALRDVGDLVPRQGLHGHIKAAVPRAQAQDRHRPSFPCR
jgi:hypothetical protein